MPIFTTTLEDVELEIRYTAYKGHKGQRDSFGVPLEPDEDASIEIESICTKHGDNITSIISSFPMAMLEQRIKESMEP